MGAGSYEIDSKPLLWLSLRFFILLAAILCSLGLMAQTTPSESAEKTLLLDQAETLISVEGRSERGLAQLPYHWDKLHTARSGGAEFEMAFELPGEPSVPHALFIPRLGNRFEVWLNGVLLSQVGIADGAHASDASDTRLDTAKQPLYLAIAPTLLQKTNLLRIKLQADALRRAGLEPVLIGPEKPVQAAYAQALRWQNHALLAALALMLALALVAGALWWTQPPAGASAQQGVQQNAQLRTQRDPLYAWAAVLALLWALCLADRWWAQAPLSWPTWGVLLLSAQLALAGLALYGMVRIVRRGQGSWALRAVLACTVLAVGAELLAWALALPQHGVLPVSLAAAAMLGVCMLALVVQRFRAAAMQSRDLMHTLELRVAAREAELAQSYQQLEQLAREQAQAQERTRILRDMHDGVGAHISAAIRQVQNSVQPPGQTTAAGQEALLQTLRDSLDQLKLSIDSMHLQSGDVTALLANLRYRLEPRLAASGIALLWEVDELPELTQLDHAAMRQLQFMLFEAFSNVLQHSGASRLLVQARAQDAAVRIRVADNGRGFDVQATASRGLASMHERAKAIGAQLHIENTGKNASVPSPENNSTVVQITLPIL